MVRLRLTALLVPLAPLLAQQPARPSPAEQMRQKLASPFLKKAAWELDYDAARAKAKARGQLVFGYFTTAGP